jgi:hypothetical protein
MSGSPSQETARLRVWAPPQSPISIEYAPLVLSQARDRAKHTEYCGVLYGECLAGHVRVLSLRQHAKYVPVGICFARPRGEVFVTEQELNAFPAKILLVIAGERAGFFVREDDGSMQTVRSLEEIPLEHAGRKRKHSWIWKAALSFALAGIPIAAGGYLQPAQPERPLRLGIDEHGDQLQIRWDYPTANSVALEILDGGERRVVPLNSSESQMTYAQRTRNVEVRLLLDNHIAKVARYVNATDPHASLRAEIRELEQLVEGLQHSFDVGEEHKQKLEWTITRLRRGL